MSACVQMLLNTYILVIMQHVVLRFFGYKRRFYHISSETYEKLLFVGELKLIIHERDHKYKYDREFPCMYCCQYSALLHLYVGH